jgi:alpha-methylacyl-CoA racemase
MARNPRLVYGRMTGWGQTGPYAATAGHDINYIALTGILHSMGPKDRPMPPLNLVGDFGGGALHLAFGMVCALLECKTSGCGQVVDAAMVDGAASMLTMIYGMAQAGVYQDQRMSNVLDGGSPYYSTYATKDGQFVAIGPIEEKFYRELLAKLNLQDNPVMHDQNDKAKWPRQREIFRCLFLTKSRREWCDLLEGTDVCFAPVMSIREAHQHPHMAHRRVFEIVHGVRQPAPAPRLSRTPGAIQGPPAKPGQHSKEILLQWGWTEPEISELQRVGAFVQA